ncbi:MAG: HD domain-containing protein [Deltaproteobacteria bacterium]
MYENRVVRHMPPIKLYDLVDIYSPEAVLEEVLFTLELISEEFNTSPITTAFDMIIDIFRGSHPHYRACNTHYHDLRHTTDAFLAMARLLHGALLNGEQLTEKEINTALVAALFHDTGYIQERGDTEGTGAKFSSEHAEKSAEFLERHGKECGLNQKQVTDGRIMILCTDVSQDIEDISFPSQKVEFLGRLLNAADILGQMSDRTYLEKLLFLYHEYKEGNVGNYKSEADLLRRTMDFYAFIDRRLQPIIERANRYVVSHLTSRWNINTNLYTEAIEGQRKYLERILSIPNVDPRNYLHRYAIIRKVRAIYGPG